MERQEDFQTGDFQAKAREGVITDTLRIRLPQRQIHGEMRSPE